MKTQVIQFHFMMAHKYTDRNSDQQDFIKAKAHAEVAISLYGQNRLQENGKIHIWDNDAYKAICENYKVEPYQLLDDEQLKQIEKLTGKD